MRFHRHHWGEANWGYPLPLHVRICQRCDRWEFNEAGVWTLLDDERKIAQLRLNGLLIRAEHGQL